MTPDHYLASRPRSGDLRRALVGPMRGTGNKRRQPDEPAPSLVIATMHRAQGTTGVQTHVRELLQYLERRGDRPPLITPFSWGGPLTVPVFGARLPLSRLSTSAGVAWHRRWHEVFLRNALRRQLARNGACVVYAQGPLAARAALHARRGPQQRVVMAIHFRVSQADEWADKGLIKREGRVFRRIRQVEREVIPHLDGLVPVTTWARDAVVRWLPEAAPVPYAVIGNFVHVRERDPGLDLLGDLVTVGRLEHVKNHHFQLEMLAEAKRLGMTYTLDVFGEGPCLRELMQLSSSLGLAEAVRFRGFHHDLREQLPRYRAYLHTAYSESSSLAIMEAMGAGLPILAGHLEPLAELFDEGVEGRFFSLDDPAEAATAVIDMLECESARLKAASAASDRFRRHFDADVVAPRLLTFLETTARASGTAPCA